LSSDHVLLKEGAVIHVELTHSFATPVEDGFAYITDTRNWHEYWPDFVRLENPQSVSWSAPGDTATVVSSSSGARRI